MLNWIVSSTSVVANQRRFGSAQMLIFYFFPARFLPSPPLALRDILACVFTYMLVDLLGLDNFSIFPYRYVLGRNHPYLCQKPWCDRQGEHIFNIGNLVVGESVIFFSVTCMTHANPLVRALLGKRSSLCPFLSHIRKRTAPHYGHDLFVRSCHLA